MPLGSPATDLRDRTDVPTASFWEVDMAVNDTLQASAYPSRLSHNSDSIRWPALVACALGAVIVFGVGFAGPELIHNAAHDTRHSINFPCH
jgi:cobalt transporter subunit CbtB